MVFINTSDIHFMNFGLKYRLTSLPHVYQIKPNATLGKGFLIGWGVLASDWLIGQRIRFNLKPFLSQQRLVLENSHYQQGTDSIIFDWEIIRVLGLIKFLEFHSNFELTLIRPSYLKFGHRCPITGNWQKRILKLPSYSPDTIQLIDLEKITSPRAKRSSLIKNQNLIIEERCIKPRSSNGVLQQPIKYSEITKIGFGFTEFSKPYILMQLSPRNHKHHVSKIMHDC